MTHKMQNLTMLRKGNKQFLCSTQIPLIQIDERIIQNKDGHFTVPSLCSVQSINKRKTNTEIDQIDIAAAQIVALTADTPRFNQGSERGIQGLPVCLILRDSRSLCKITAEPFLHDTKVSDGQRILCVLQKLLGLHNDSKSILCFLDLRTCSCNRLPCLRQPLAFR